LQIAQGVPADGPAGAAFAAEKIDDPDDPHAVGRYISEKDTIGAVPSYTRSKIRLAFKEQEVNSKTTWFSKLFRGDPPATFKIIPDDADEDHSADTYFVPKLQWEKPSGRMPEPVADGDPELSHLLHRIKTSGETRIAPRPQPVAVEPEPVVASGPPIPFVERRAAPRPIEIVEYRVATAAAPIAPASIAPAPAPPIQAAIPAVWQPAVPAPLTPPLAAAPPSFAVPAPPAPAPPAPPAVSGSRPYGRPLRPLTFQQLAGSIEAEALHDQPQHVAEPVLEGAPSAEPKAQAPEPPQPPDPPVAAQAPLQQPAAAPPANPWELPVAPISAAPLPAAAPAPAPPVQSASHTGMPMWPAKEPIAAFYAPPYQPAALTPISEPATPAAVEAITPATFQPEPPHEEPAHASEFIAPSPSARRGTFERIPIVADPLTDPAPAQRAYRLEAHAEAVERPSDPEPMPSAPAPAPVAVATVPSGTSFPPDHEARLHMFARRRSDLDGGGDAPGMSRRWKLLSQFEPVLSDPLPAHRKGYSRATDLNPPRRSDEG
jgi:hypothetical protein